jgi:predicted RNA-binding Zn-ribbon protein involved in translation (DUF1610 family)
MGDVIVSDAIRVFVGSSSAWDLCPYCGADITGCLLEIPYFTPTDGGPPSTAGGFIQEAWVEGTQECPDCGHKWEVNG